MIEIRATKLLVRGIEETGEDCKFMGLEVVRPVHEEDPEATIDVDEKNVFSGVGMDDEGEQDDIMMGPDATP